MYGELTEKEAIERVDRALDHHLADQFEILLYKKNRAYLHYYRFTGAGFTHFTHDDEIRLLKTWNTK